MTQLLINTRRPDVTFYHDGRIDITARIAKLLNLKRGDVIGIATHNEEYYLYVRLRAADAVGRHQAQCTPTKCGKRHSNNFRAYSQRLCQIIISATSKDPAEPTEPARLPAGLPINIPQIGTSVPLITRHPL